MGYLFQLLPAKNIQIDLDVKSKKRVFDQAGLLFEQSIGIGRKSIFEAFLEREKMGSTALGNGVAIPHGRLDNLKKSTAAFIRSKNGIPFEAPDNKPVFFFFFLLVPAKATELHLQILSELSQLFSTENILKKMHNSKTPEQIYEIFCDWGNHA